MIKEDGDLKGCQEQPLWQYVACDRLVDRLVGKESSLQFVEREGCDALPSPGVNPLEGSPKYSCGKLGLRRRSRLPTLERGRGSSWEPRD